MPANPFSTLMQSSGNTPGMRSDLLSPQAASIINRDRANSRNIVAANTPIPGPTRGGGSTGASNDVLNNAAARDQRILDETFGVRDQIMGDPSQQLAQDFLAGVINGQNLPFNDQVRSAILSGASDQAGNTAANQREAIIKSAARQGLNVNDPAVQARLNAVTGQQGLAGQAALQNLNQTAGVANFNAQSGSANDLARQRLAQFGAGGQFSLQGVNMLANRNIGQTVAGPQQGVGFNFTTVPRAGGSSGSNPPNIASNMSNSVARFPVAGANNTPATQPGASIATPRPRVSEVGNRGADLSQFAAPSGNFTPIGQHDPFGHSATGAL